jgi:hypothetical protein
MIAPPRFANWLLEAVLPPAEADAVSGDLCEEFTVFVVPQRGRLGASFWYCWQVARSLGPIVLRTWQRATVSRASVAVVGAALATTLPAGVLVLLRTFTLQQVPLKTTTEPSLLFVAILAGVVIASGALGLAAALRVLHGAPRS